MTNPGTLQFGGSLFELEQAEIYGIFEPHGYMTWHIELFPRGEDNYIMFNALVFENIVLPQQLSNLRFEETTGSADLYEHTVLVNGRDRFMESVDMTFGEWDTATQSVALNGHGMIKPDGNLPEMPYTFSALLRFKEIDIFETSREETQRFVDAHLKDLADRIEISFTDVPSGLRATIRGEF